MRNRQHRTWAESAVSSNAPSLSWQHCSHTRVGRVFLRYWRHASRSSDRAHRALRWRLRFAIRGVLYVDAQTVSHLQSARRMPGIEYVSGTAVIARIEPERNWHALVGTRRVPPPRVPRLLLRASVRHARRARRVAADAIRRRARKPGTLDICARISLEIRRAGRARCAGKPRPGARGAAAVGAQRKKL